MNVTTAKFGVGSKRTTAESLTQFDYGQILVIDGLELPNSFEAHFSNQAFDGNSKSQIGFDNQVQIPDEYLMSGDAIYVLIIMHYGSDDGKTEYKITIPVDKRPRPTKITPSSVEQSVITQLMAAMQTAVSNAEDEADRAANEAEAAEVAKNSILEMEVEACSIAPDETTYVEKSVDDESGSIKLDFYISRGLQGERGVVGPTFTPTVSNSGVLSWTNNGDLENPDDFNIVQAVLEALPEAEEGRF